MPSDWKQIKWLFPGFFLMLGEMSWAVSQTHGGSPCSFFISLLCQVIIRPSSSVSDLPDASRNVPCDSNELRELFSFPQSIRQMQPKLWKPSLDKAFLICICLPVKLKEIKVLSPVLKRTRDKRHQTNLPIPHCSIKLAIIYTNAQCKTYSISKEFKM